MNIHIRGGRVVDPATGSERRQDVFVSGGTIAGLGKAPSGFGAARVIDADGLVVCPGLVDVSVRVREPGQEHRATLESELAAAVAGGVTSVCCPPDTDPPLDEPGLVEMLKHRARELHLARLYPLGALTQGLRGERLAEMSELADAGCIAFSQADSALGDAQVLMRAMQYASTFGYCVWLRPQDVALARGGVAHDGEVATRLGLPAIPVVAETVALSTMLLLARDCGVRLHLCRLSSAEGVEMVRQAKAMGVRVSADVSVNHLHLSDMDIGYFDSNCNLVPPLRGQRDRDALRSALADGTIDLVCSDHSPVDDDAKQLPFGEAAPGASGIELLLPLTLKWAEQAGLDLPRALARVTTAPCALLGVDGGRLSPGAPADLCLFDDQEIWRVEPAALRSQGKNTPFTGLDMKGRVIYTLVEGEVAFDARRPG